VGAVIVRSVAASPSVVPVAFVAQRPPRARPVRHEPRRLDADISYHASLSPVRAPDGRTYAVAIVSAVDVPPNGRPQYAADVLAPRSGDPQVLHDAGWQQWSIGDLLIVALASERAAVTTLDDAADQLADLAAGGRWIADDDHAVTLRVPAPR